jgi:hypothetical protein
MALIHSNGMVLSAMIMAKFIHGNAHGKCQGQSMAILIRVLKRSKDRTALSALEQIDLCQCTRARIVDAMAKALTTDINTAPTHTHHHAHLDGILITGIPDASASQCSAT